ncbi:MAG: trypsin-like peptidase domain-containing protein [Deltaproteobacteria bacterium]|nr:trypsin-like peptidase domain-containing protein [Deltaproteobacteria bacterium]
MPIVIEVLSGARRGHRVVLDKPVVTLGRHPDNDLVFDALSESMVSAFHAELREQAPGRWTILDRGSSNGTWVGGDRLTQLAFDGRLELRLAQGGPRLTVMPLLAVPAQAADAVTLPEALPRPRPAGLDPLVVAPTLDSPGSSFRGPARIGGPADASPPGGAALPGAGGPGRRPDAVGREPGRPPDQAPLVPSWQRAPVFGPTSDTRDRGFRPGVTAQIRTLAGELVRRSSRRFWVAVTVLGLLLAAATTLLVLVLTGVVEFGSGRPATAGPRAAAGPPVAADASGATPATAAPEPPQAAVKRIVVDNRDAIFLLGAEILGRSEGFCTGFALTSRILATNAHCVLEMQKIWKVIGDGQGVFAYQNEHPGVKHRVQLALMHPGYAEDDSDAIYPDIGLAVLAGRTDRQVRLATKERAAELRVGDRVYLLGFPGALNNTDSPVATLTEGLVSRLTDLTQRKAEPDGAVLIQHSAFTTKGTSGSPLFDETGAVIGINTGYYRGEAEQQRVDPVTGRVRGEMVTQDLQNYAIGMRVDLVHDLLQLLYERIPGTQDGADAGAP